jgi:uncharacterized phage protein (TIGR02220 family)
MDIEKILPHLIDAAKDAADGTRFDDTLLEQNFRAVFSVFASEEKEKERELRNRAVLIIEKLNEMTGKKFKANNPANIKYVTARLKEGYRGADFVHVIKVKSEQWLGTDQEMYLRPETLFSARHFESYLNEKVKEEPKPIDKGQNFFNSL